MKIKLGSKKSGFTIIELMIVIIIVAILVALAYPSYIKYARKAKRGDAQQLLMNWSINQEIWRSHNTSYASASDITPPCRGDGADCDYYFEDPSDLTATTFTLTATALGDQVKDKAKNGAECTALTLNQNGVKQPAGCWE